VIRFECIWGKKKEIFLTKKDLSWKLMPIGDGPFQILEKLNDNAYKVNLPSDYNVSVTFNIFYLFLFDVGDSWMNLF